MSIISRESTVKHLAMDPTLYDAHQRRYSDDLPFWLALAENHVGTILELGCGTGRVLLPLLAAEHTITGLDHDPAMLEIARRQLPADVAGRADLIEADVTVFELNRHFALVIFPCNTYTTLDMAQRATTLENVRKHLDADGVFALSVPNPLTFASLSSVGESEIEDSFEFNEAQQWVQVSSTWQRAATHIVFSWHYDVMHPDGNVQRHSASVRQNIVAVSKIEREFERAGFQIRSRYGNFDRSHFNEDAPYLIYILSTS